MTGVRAIAAYFVFFHHYAPPLPSGALSSHLLSLTRELHVGVTIFFVLSGFMIAYRYYDQARFELSWFKEYFRARFARIYPMYFLLTLLAFGSWRALHTSEFWLNITMLRGFSNTFKFTGVAQGWSLTVEECFYASAPFLFFFFKRQRTWIPFLLIPTVGWFLVQAHLGSSFMENMRFMWLYTFFGRFSEFFVGVALARAWQSGLLEKLARRVKGGVLTYAGIVGFLACLEILAHLRPSRDDVHAISLYMPPLGIFHPVGIATNNLILPIAIAVFYAGLLTERTIVSRFLATGMMVLLGKASYTFYLIHFGAFHAMVLPTLGSDYLTNFVGMNLFAIALFKFVEEPLHQLFRLGRVESVFFRGRKKLAAVGLR